MGLKLEVGDVDPNDESHEFLNSSEIMTRGVVGDDHWRRHRGWRNSDSTSRRRWNVNGWS